MGFRNPSAELSGDRGVWKAERGAAGIAGVGDIAGETRRRRGIGASSLIFLIYLYKLVLSPFLGGACKFHPSCSNYAQEAVERWGARRGGWLAVKRLGRCRPFVSGGYDPVPEDMESEGGAK